MAYNYNLKDELEKLKYDRRLLNFNLSNGIINQSDWESNLQSLSDDKDKSEAFFLDDEDEIYEDEA